MFYENESFCYRCGESRDGRPTAEQRETQMGIAKNLLFFGILVIVLSVAIPQIRTNGYPGSIWIKSWYDDPYDTDGKLALRGDQYMSWAQTAGEAISGIGVLALGVAGFNGRRRTPKPPRG